MSGITAYENTRRIGWGESVVCRYRTLHLLHRKACRCCRQNAGQFEIITSPITLPETLMKPLQAKDEPLIAQYRTMFFNTKGIAIADITASIGNIAADLRTRYNLRTPDALHIATAMDAGRNAFLTNDLGLKRVTELKVLVLDNLNC